MSKRRKSHVPYPLTWWMKFRMPKTFFIETPLPIEEVSDRLFVAFNGSRSLFSSDSIRRRILDEQTLYVALAYVCERHRSYIKSRAIILDLRSATQISGVVYMPLYYLIWIIPILGISTLFYVSIMSGMLSGELGGEVQGLCTYTGIYALIVYGFVIDPIRKYRRACDVFPDHLQQILADGRKASKS
jgi:hypothetical protein